MAGKFGVVRFQVAQVNVDPTQYKPYSHTLLAENVFVDIPVDEKELKRVGETIILTVEGLTALLSVVAESIDNMDTIRRNKKFGH